MSAEQHAGGSGPDPGDGGEPAGAYDVPFVWESSHGHMVELLVEHVEPGLVLDIGCGYAPHAEQLSQRGFDLVGVDLDPGAVADLEARGFAAAVGDLGDPPALVATIEQLTAGREVGAVLAMDVLEHLAEPLVSLAAVVEWMGARAIDVLGISLPNVSHQDVAVKLLAGRWDLTPTGLLDHTHLRFFNERAVDELTGSAGAGEMARHDVKSAKSDQFWPIAHPLVSDASQLGQFTRSVRQRADGHGDTFQFVRLYRRSGEPEPPSAAHVADGDPEQSSVGVSVVASTVGARSRPELHDALASQTSNDFEVVAGDEQLGELVRRCVGRYVVVVGDELGFDDEWIERFLIAADRYPGVVLRCGARFGERDQDHSGGFDLVGHLVRNSTPMATIAFPRPLLSDFNLEFVAADPDQGWYSVLVEAATLVGVANTDAVSVTMPPGWQHDPAGSGEHAAEVRRRLDRRPWLMPVGTAEHLSNLVDHGRQLEHRVEQADARAAQLAAENERLAAELDVAAVRLLRRLLRRGGRSGP